MPDRKVDPNDPLPRYYQIYTSLLERIQSGEFTPGSAIPTERELGDEYGVSRITVIKALDMLERDGHMDGSKAGAPLSPIQPRAQCWPTAIWLSYARFHLVQS